jgi:hypothetical protein
VCVASNAIWLFILDDFTRTAVKATRWYVGFMTFGLSTVIHGGFKALEHDCIELLYVCNVCGNEGKYTADFGTVLFATLSKQGIKFVARKNVASWTVRQIALC